MGAEGDGGRAYAREELVAELGGCCWAIGSRSAAPWPTMPLQVLSDARRAADLICPEGPEALPDSPHLARRCKHAMVSGTSSVGRYRSAGLRPHDAGWRHALHLPWLTFTLPAAPASRGLAPAFWWS
jgi:hypothetical protein